MYKFTRYILLAGLLFLQSVTVHSEEANIKSEQEIEKSLFPITVRGIVPVKLEDSAADRKEQGDSPDVISKVDLQAITFEFNSSVLTNNAKQQLANLAAVLQTKDLLVYSFELIGHTDASGANGYNLKLSERRARAAADYLFQTHNIAASNFEVRGLGETRPVNKSDPYAAENRRVEIVRRK